MMQIQGHKPHGVREKNYKRRQLDQLRPLHERLEAWALKEAGIPFAPLPAVLGSAWSLRMAACGRRREAETTRGLAAPGRRCPGGHETRPMVGRQAVARAR